jgi:apolipoprotein N-acyltransferase
MSWTRRLILPGRCLLAGLCIAASVPPWGWWPLAFVGIALLDRLIADQPWKRRLRRTWLVAAAWLYPAMFWMWDLTPPGYLLAGAFYAAYFAVAAALCPPGRARWLALPGLFLLAEVARWSWPFGGVPLGTLAMSQAAAPLGQTARLLGAYLVVVLVVAGGVALSAAWERDWKVAGGVLAGLVACCGLALVAPRGHDVGPLRVALVQGGGEQGTRAEDTDPRQVFERHLEASRLVTEPVDLVLWPENVVAVEGRLTSSKENVELSNLAQDLDATLIVGATEGITDKHFLNAAVVYNPDGTMGARYDKVRIVPFGEYVPLRGLIERLAGENSGLPARDALPGTGPAVLPTEVGEMGVVISWEVFFPTRARDAIDHGGEVLLNPTNGSSYWLTIVQSQQVASSRLRAIETGRWTLQAAPTGFSAIVTPDGEVTQRTGISEQAVLQQTIQKRQGQTIATVVGPWPMLAWALVSLVAAWLLQRRSTAADTEPAEPEPTDPAEAAEPTEPAEPAEPTDPADPAEPAERPERG